MRKIILCLAVLFGLTATDLQAKDLVVYFSATGNTQRLAWRAGCGAYTL